MNLTDQHNMTDSAAGLEPAISVVMPAYNAERYLDQAIQSILDQGFQNFEFIIIDDASTDNTLSLLNAFSTKDQRIKIHSNVENLGVAESLNLGFKMARGRYIARMDADDISLPQRFSKQAAFLDANSDFAFVGTGYQIINADGRITRTDIEATEAWECEWMSIFRMPVIHPSMMIRASIVQSMSVIYDNSFEGAEDYDLAQRLLKLGKGKALSEVLFQYRMHDESVSAIKSEIQKTLKPRITQQNKPGVVDQCNPEEIFDFFRETYADPQSVYRATIFLAKIEKLCATDWRLSFAQRQKMRAFSIRWLFSAAMISGRLQKPNQFLSFFWHSRAYARAYLSEAISYFSRRIQRG